MTALARWRYRRWWDRQCRREQARLLAEAPDCDSDDGGTHDACQAPATLEAGAAFWRRLGHGLGDGCKGTEASLGTLPDPWLLAHVTPPDAVTS